MPGTICTISRRSIISPPGERADCEDRAGRLAARLAAKEAVAKALGTGIGTVSWRDIEVRCESASGRPRLQLHGAAAAVAAGLGLTHWDLSLTHTAGQAAAIAVAQRGSDPRYNAPGRQQPEDQ